MRTMPTGVDTLLAAVSRAHHQRVWFGPPGEALVDMTDYLLPGTVHEEGINEPVDMLVLHLDRSIGSASLSPLMTADPPVDLNFVVVWEVAVTDQVTSPTSGDWIEKFRGSVWDVDATHNDMVVTCQGLAGKLNERLTLAGQTIAAGTDLEDAIQAVLDGPTPSIGVTLNTPVSPAASLDQTLAVTHQPVLRAALDLAGSIGWVARYWWDETAGEFLFTLMEPPRDKVTPDWTTSAARYIAVPEFRRTKQDIRNSVTVYYGPADEDGDQASVTSSDSGSITEFGILEAVFREGTDSPLQTEAQAQAFADAFISDMAWPDVTHTVTDFDLPNIELWDLIRFTANDVHYNTNQDLAVQSIRREFPAMGVARITLGCRGKPSAGVGMWRRRAVTAPGQGPQGEQGPPGEPGDQSQDVIDVIVSGPSGGLYTVKVTLGADVEYALAHIHDFTGSLPSNYLDTLKASEPDHVGLVSGDTFTVDEPAAGSNIFRKGLVTPWIGNTPSGKGVEFTIKAKAGPLTDPYDFADDIRPPVVVSSLPSGNPDNLTLVFLTTDEKLYKWDGADWVPVVRAVDLDGEIGSSQIADSAVTTGKIAAGAVSTAKVAALAITEALLAAGAVTETKITDSSISTPKLAALAVTAAKIASGTITANEIAALTILAGNIASGAITTAKLDALAVTAEKIAALAVTTAKLDALAVTAEKVAANAITTDKIDANAITAGKIAAGAIGTTQLAADAVTAEKLAALTIEVGKYIQSDDYVAGVSGWKIDGAGNAEFNDGDFRGTVTIDSDGLGNSIAFEHNGDPVAALTTGSNTVTLYAENQFDPLIWGQLEIGDTQVGLTTSGLLQLSADEIAIATNDANLSIAGLPTSSPGIANRVWRDAGGFLRIA